MHAHKLRATIPQNHQLTIDIPGDFPTGEAEIILIASAAEQQVDQRPPRRISVDELLAAKLKPLPGTGSVSQEDIDRVIGEGWAGRGNI
jgi:hypothetical protein